jgi:hypothetical protein
VALGHLYLDYDGFTQAEQVFSECIRANETSAECFNGHGLALKELKKFEQAPRRVQEGARPGTDPGQRAVQLRHDLRRVVRAVARQRAQGEGARLPAEVRGGGGGKDGGFGYVKAANDKLYALSGS